MSTLRYPPAGEFVPADIVSQNLNRLDLDFSGSLNARRAHLRELALSIADACEDVDELLEVLVGFGTGVPFTPQTIGENMSFLRVGFAQLSLLERTELCRMLCAMPSLSLKTSDFFPPDEPIALIARSTIAYLQNNFADRAFHAFTQVMPRARAQYHDTYQSVCEAVASGNCEACILPIEHAQDGKLISFYRLIDRYDLKIVCSCALAQNNGPESRFALLKKNISFARPTQTHLRYFELSITQNGDETIGALLTAAQLYGLCLRRIDAIPLEYADEGFAFHIMLSFETDIQLLPFLLYLTLELPQYNPVGIFAHIAE